MGIVSQVNCFPFPATALTHDNVLKGLKELDWETLCNTGSSYIINRIYPGVLELPESEGKRIERIHISEEERKSAGVLWWVDHHPLASWRLLITGLDWERKHSLANRIHQYAEKVTGMLSCIVFDSQLVGVNMRYTHVQGCSIHGMCIKCVAMQPMHEVNSISQ